jgi:hypothetical protein
MIAQSYDIRPEGNQPKRRNAKNQKRGKVEVGKIELTEGKGEPAPRSDE